MSELRKKFHEPMFWMYAILIAFVVSFSAKAWGVLGSNIEVMITVVGLLAGMAFFSYLSEYALIAGGCMAMGTFIVASTAAGMEIVDLTPRMIVLMMVVVTINVVLIVEAFIRNAERRIV